MQLSCTLAPACSTMRPKSAQRPTGPYVAAGADDHVAEELRTGAADGARLRAALAQVARERDDAAGELDRTRRERDELASAKRALEQVHTALAQARARLG